MSNRVEIHLADDPEQFRQLAESLRSLLGGLWTAQLDGLDQSYWDLSTPYGTVTIHREHYLGVSVWGASAALERVRSDFPLPA